MTIKTLISAAVFFAFLPGCRPSGTTDESQVPPAESARDAHANADADEDIRSSTRSATAVSPTVPETALPGATGPRVVEVAQPDPSIELSGAYVISDYGQEKEPPRIFPSGTTELKLVYKFKKRPPDNTRLSFALLGKSGPIETEGGFPLEFENRATGAFSVTLPIKSKMGAFPDGPYEAAVMINGETICKLNWAVGATNPPN